MKALKVLALFCLLFLYSADNQAQHKRAVRFAFLTDLHISDVAANAEDLELSVSDLNSMSNLDFVIFGGDITEFGSDEEIAHAHAIISKLRVPWYIVGGNHDSKWSESGCNTFKDVFGYEWFEFEAGGIRFLGCNSGPNMRMAPALVPRDAVLWLDSLTKSIPPATPVVFINHYPLDDAMLNYTTILDYLSRVNVQFAMCGHGHNNRTFSYKVPGSPNTAVTPVIRGVMGRSNLRAGKGAHGYNIIEIDQANGNITFTERSGGKNLAPWHTIKMLTPPPAIKTTTLFNYQDDSDIGSGAVIASIQSEASKSSASKSPATTQRIFWANANGVIKAFDLKSNQPVWTFKTGGKIFSTPAIAEGSLVVGSSDTYIYSLDIKSGKLLWKYKATKSVLASPTIHKGVVYIGASDGIFRALDLKTGKLVWEFKDVKGFVESKAWVDDSGVYFGTWGSMLYALSPKDGSLLWNWTNHKGRGLSPAAVWPVKANGKIFVATPERMTHAIDAATGTELWRARGGRESVGLSPDATTLYIKTMQDTVFAYRTDVNFTITATPAASSAAQTLVSLKDNSLRKWTSHTGYGYEIAPSAITSAYGYLFIPTDKGNIFVLNEADGSVAGIIRFSGALINHVLPTGNRQILVSSMDGRVSLLKLD